MCNETYRFLVTESRAEKARPLEGDRGDLVGWVEARNPTTTIYEISDRHLCGSDVLHAIIMNVSRHVPVLVHSVNVSQAPVMAQGLERAGICVTHIPMDKLTKEKLAE